MKSKASIPLSTSTGSFGRLFLAVLLVATLAGLCFANSIGNPLLNWDDQVYIKENPYIREFTWSNLKAIFTRPYFKNYAPLHLLSYQLDYRLFGLQPEGYRAVNVLFHILNSILVFLLIMELYHSFNAALIGAAIFAVHTIHVESVVWLSQRKDVLSAFFFLFSLYGYIQFRKRQKSHKAGTQGSGPWVLEAGCLSLDTNGALMEGGLGMKNTRSRISAGGTHTFWYLFSLGLFLLALLTKPIAVTLPLILLLYELCFHKEDYAIRLKDKIPFFLLACLAAAVTFWAQSVDTGIKEYFGHNFFYSILLTGKILVMYLEKLLVPLGLSGRYVFLPSGLFTPSLAFSWLLIVIFLGGIAFLWGNRQATLAFPGVFFLFTLLPVANLVPTSTQMADRYLYLPSFCYSLAVGLLVSAFIKRAGQREKGKLLQAAVVFLTIGLIAFYGSLTWARNRVWRSDRSLWEDALSTDPNNYHAATHLADTYLNEAKKERSSRQKELDLQQASRLLQHSMRIKPDFALAYLEMGNVLLEEGKATEAIPILLLAAGKNDERRNSPRIEHNLGIAYLRAGLIPAAQEAFTRAIRHDPRFAPAYLSLGTIYFDYGTLQGYRMAEEQYLHATEASPSDSQSFFYLAIARERLEDFPSAIDNYQKALRLVREGSSSVNPADVHINLAGLYYRLGDYQKAAEHYRQVLRLDPHHAQAEAVRSMLRSLGVNP
ncbi:MAG: tetratricopeptide repeat protein [bacterium]